MPRLVPVPFEPFDGSSNFEMNVGGRALPRHDEWLLAPSYWDAVTLGLVRTAMQAAAVSNGGVAAIANGSHTADSAVELDSALCLSNESVSEQSLVVTRHACLRVRSVQHERTAALAGPRIFFIFGRNSKPSLMRALMDMRMRETSIGYSARDIVIGDDDTEAQADKRREGQLGCCRVV
jgi:hypothetical protein